MFGALPAPPEVEEIDELGRVVPKPTPAQRRVARIARRQQRHPGQNAEDEGYSTDSSLPASDHKAYFNALASLRERTKQVLADVRAEEFRDPRKGRWSMWRERYADSYKGAWGGLGVVSVWEFWVRLESVGWDCIDVRLISSMDLLFRSVLPLYYSAGPSESRQLQVVPRPVFLFSPRRGRGRLGSRRRLGGFDDIHSRHSQTL